MKKIEESKHKKMKEYNRKMKRTDLKSIEKPLRRKGMKGQVKNII